MPDYFIKTKARCELIWFVLSSVFMMDGKLGTQQQHLAAAAAALAAEHRFHQAQQLQ
jgi:hypothetical protein